MEGPSAQEIECRAYRLWEEAGQPQGRDEVFYVEAERQLKEKLRQVHGDQGAVQAAL
jgi:ribosomal protein L35AE/L33A